MLKMNTSGIDEAIFSPNPNIFFKKVWQPTLTWKILRTVTEQKYLNPHMQTS